ncbi:hypothetical protein V2J94_34800 [Streptomyces sp. DSM 41524]|uniref:Helicase XPB/Ssl2 N-terminal domain-containing protein n=1 Tax=Streptomyces asiaticus subsp. ignotus TaxID=3098222 RepID=A0ABU7Q6H6_9ACTN|nr:hypothetical protein [Streptomyces sp. DSM 41524]
MALVAVSRSGPLRQRIAKGYGVHVPDPRPGHGPAELIAALLANPPLMPTLPDGGTCVLRTGTRARAALWIDTGRVSLHDAAARTRVAGVLAAAVAAVAVAVRGLGGLLLPTGWLQQPDPLAGLCADLHSVEVLGPVQRELLTNTVREHTAPLIALTGRQLYGPGGVTPGGSARLSRSFGQVATRYLDSCSPAHLDRVRTRLHQEERLGRLEAMDVNPLGEAEAGARDDVTVRLFDAQVTVSGALAHALLVQALSMSSRELERTGRRVRVVPQPVIERDRARAVAHGFAAELGGDEGRRGDGAPPAPVKARPAAQAVRELLHRLMPFFRQLEATVDELAPLFIGVELAESAGTTTFVRNENDLLARWWSHDATALTPERLGQGLTMPDWLTTDQVSAMNRHASAGRWAGARVWLAERLTHPDPGPGRPDSAGVRAGAKDTTRAAPLTGEQFLDRVAEPDLPAAQVLDALRAYCRGGGVLDLVRPLRSRGRDDARALRRVLRPRGEQRVQATEPLSSWDDSTADRALSTAREKGWALLRWDLPEQDRARVRKALRSLGRAPDGVRHILLTDTTYTGRENERRGTVEVLLVAPPEEADR